MANSKCEGGHVQRVDEQGNSTKTTTKNIDNGRVKVQWPKSCSKVFPSCRAMNQSPTQVSIEKREAITGLKQEKEHDDNVMQNQDEEIPNNDYQKQHKQSNRNDQEINGKYEEMRENIDNFKDTNSCVKTHQCILEKHSCDDGEFPRRDSNCKDEITETNSCKENNDKITETNSSKDNGNFTESESFEDNKKCNKSCEQTKKCNKESYSEEDTATIARLRAQRRWRMGLLKRAKFGGFGDTDVSDLFPDYFPSPFTITQGNEDDDILTSLKESKQRHRAKLLKQNSIDKIDRELGDRETKLIAGSWLQIYS